MPPRLLRERYGDQVRLNEAQWATLRKAADEGEQRATIDVSSVLASLLVRKGLLERHQTRGRDSQYHASYTITARGLNALEAKAGH